MSAKHLVAHLLAGSPLMAGTATFFGDGKDIARLVDDTEIRVMRLGTEGDAPLDIPEKLRGEPCAVSRTADGHLIVLNEIEALVLNPDTKKWSSLIKAPAGTHFLDVALDAATGRLLFSTGHADDSIEWRILMPGETGLKSVITARAPQPMHPVFDSNGNLFFSCLGDLWKGKITMASEDDIASGFPAFQLDSERILPLAIMETSEGNGTGVSVKEIAPIGGQLLVDLSRTNGTGWGDLILVADKNIIREKKALEMKKLGAITLTSNLAVSPDGKTVFACVDGIPHLYDQAKGALAPLSKGD